MKGMKLLGGLIVACGLMSALHAGAWAAADGSLQEQEPCVHMSDMITFEPDEAHHAAALYGNVSAADVRLAEGEHAAWIDRIDTTGDRAFVRQFYNGLVAGSKLKCDGGTASLIEDHTPDAEIDIWYRYPEMNVGETYSFATFKEVLQKNGQPYHPRRIEAAGRNVGLVTNVKAVQETDFDTFIAESQAYTFAAFGAFLRDHPESFWLDSCQMGAQNLYCSDGQGYFVSYIVLRHVDLENSSNNFDIRGGQSASELTALIQERDERTKQIIQEGKFTGNTSDLTKLRYFNDWLTRNNQYNTNLPHEPASAHTCMSALRGSEGASGPVCEGYAEALKVLCDRVGIPCILVSGQGRINLKDQGAHMWNSVQINDTWYGVDVGWNDPVGGTPGKKSGFETEAFLLQGSGTVTDDGMSFAQSHIVENTAMNQEVQLLNGPTLSPVCYEETGFRLMNWDAGSDQNCTVTRNERGHCFHNSERGRTKLTDVRTVQGRPHTWDNWTLSGDVCCRHCKVCGCTTPVSLQVTGPAELTAEMLTVTATVSGASVSQPLLVLIAGYGPDGQQLFLKWLPVVGDSLRTTVDNRDGKLGKLSFFLMDGAAVSPVSWTPLAGMGAIPAA